MKKKAMKKAAKKSAGKSKAKTKPKAKPAVKAKGKSKPAAKAKAKPRTKSGGSQGLTVVDLFKLKQEREQQVQQDAESWKHKKDLPPQDVHSPEDAKMDNVKKSGFGGTRHH